jgi:serine/threonine protein kinase
MEYAARGSLFAYVCQQRRLPEDMARWILQQIVLALDYCHKKVGGRRGRAGGRAVRAARPLAAAAPARAPPPSPPTHLALLLPDAPPAAAAPAPLRPHNPQGIAGWDIKLENTLLDWPSHLPMPLAKIAAFGCAAGRPARAGTMGAKGGRPAGRAPRLKPGTRTPLAPARPPRAAGPEQPPPPLSHPLAPPTHPRAPGTRTTTCGLSGQITSGRATRAQRWGGGGAGAGGAARARRAGAAAGRSGLWF